MNTNNFDIDARCHCSRCTEPDGYVMDARCSNCSIERTVLHRKGDRAATVPCPVCGVKALRPHGVARAVEVDHE